METVAVFLSSALAWCECAANSGSALTRALQRQARVLAQRVEVDFGEALLCQAHVIRAGAQVGQRVGRVLGHAQRVGVDELL
jgi:hypothetical protein